ncbi:MULTISPECIES: amino acid ABC transporter substrate-binding protein [Halorussus]|uniref:amino acid ABC transporter substrate-binding protein n=1 Tax=Halorussus TaxID=1070314 RepID=UPI00209C778B|nr:ABC transporter substrate-binding protein [Halorussus vallis]USZ77817.1 amino acid ABC transporter substrate-binding protein [Halorussus vallis]
MTSHSRRRFLAAMGAGGITYTAGCTSFGGSGGGSNKITIAATVSKSGSFSSAGTDVEEAYKLGEKVINDNGGILDKDVELHIEDDESTPEGVRKGLQKIVSNNDVDMIWGTFGSLLVSSAAAYAESQEIPMLSANFAYMKPHLKEGYDWTFAPFSKSRDMANSALAIGNKAPKGQRPKRVGIWQTNTGWGAELGEVWTKKLENNGYKVVLNEKYQPGSNDFSSLITKSKSANVEFLLSNPIPPGGITAIKQMRSNGFLPKIAILERAATTSSWLDATGKAGREVVCGPGWVRGLTGNGNKEMLSAYREQKNVDSGAYPSPTVGCSYNVTQTAKQAYEAAGSTKKSDVRDALRNNKFHTVIGDFSFDENGMPVEGDLAPPTGQWLDGDLRLVHPDVDSEAAGDFKYPFTPWGER